MNVKRFGWMTWLQIALIVLKLVGVINWSWWWVLSPLLITGGILMLLIILVGSLKGD